MFLIDLLSQYDFKSITANQSIFYNKDIDIIIAAHIDDLLIIDQNKVYIDNLKSQIFKKVEISDLDDAKFFLDMKITRNKDKKQLFSSQTKYIKELLIKFDINDEKSIYSSTVQGVRLKKNIETTSEHVIKLYQQQIKSLMYLMIVTRSNLAFSISNCARFMSNSSEEHIKVLQRVWQYVRISQNKDLLYRSNEELSLIEYVDSD